MSQGEIVRLGALGLSAKAIAAARGEAAETLIAEGNTRKTAPGWSRCSARAMARQASATPALTKPWKRSARKCAASARRK
jgi:hypothetical protein